MKNRLTKIKFTEVSVSEFTPGVQPVCVLDFSKVKPPKNLHKVTLYRSNEYDKACKDFPELKQLEITDDVNKSISKEITTIFKRLQTKVNKQFLFHLKKHKRRYISPPDHFNCRGELGISRSYEKKKIKN